MARNKIRFHSYAFLKQAKALCEKLLSGLNYKVIYPTLLALN